MNGSRFLLQSTLTLLIWTTLEGQVPPSQAGWPVVLPGTSDIWYRPTIADIDDDGQLEVICGLETPGTPTPYCMTVLRSDGSVSPGWPYCYVADHHGPAVVGDIDGDGAREVIWLGFYPLNMQIHVVSAAGQSLPGWPLLLPDDGDELFLLADLDGDGDDEIVLTTWQYSQGEYVTHLRVYGAGAVPHPGFPVIVDLAPWETDPTASAGPSGLSAADLDGDGADEIVVGFNVAAAVAWPDGALFVFDGDGTTLAGWPQTIPGNPGDLTCSPRLVDHDGDTQLEIVTQGFSAFRLWEVDGVSQSISGIPNCSGDAHTVVADLEGDGTIELVFSNCDVFIFRDGPYIGWDATTISVGETIRQTRVVDIDGDGPTEILAATQLGSDHRIHLFKANLEGVYEELPGWPIDLDWQGKPYLCFGDLDGDGDIELVYAERHGLHALDFPLGVGPARLEWPLEDGGLRRNGLYRDGQDVPPRFVRGDATGDGEIDIADAILCLAELFQGVEMDYDCPASRDVFGDGEVDLADPIALLSYLFVSGPSPIAPFPACGQQPPGEALGCGTIICP